MEKRLIAATVGTVALAAAGVGLLTTGHPPEQPQKVELTAEYHGIPINTVLDLNNHKYVPELLPGYETIADYPDEYWIREEVVAADPKTFKPL